MKESTFIKLTKEKHNQTQYIYTFLQSGKQLCIICDEVITSVLSLTVQPVHPGMHYIHSILKNIELYIF